MIYKEPPLESPFSIKKAPHFLCPHSAAHQKSSRELSDITQNEWLSRPVESLVRRQRARTHDERQSIQEFKRQNHMRNRLRNAFAGVATIAMMLGETSCTNENALRVEANVARNSYATREDPSSLEPISWIYAQQVGADAPTLASKYYITLKVTPGNALDAGLITVVPHDSGMALQIVTVFEGSSGSQQTTYHIDTDGYTQHLLLQQPKDKRLKIFFALGPKGGKSKHMFSAELPGMSQLGNEPKNLDLRPVQSIPEFEGRDPIKVQEWPSLPEVHLHAPAVGRKQANETSLYFCYRPLGAATRTP